ncbi:hypothetical protein LEP1GSC082_3542 [Leptospira kirschneri str. H2]|uniref:Uncharacterized protein n=2 Tax=Leptospira kirschneri TaxID=29507 RepID=A0A0E2BGM9_9LEPT|nr:hypothetical protein LEP1GSC081_3785 [Leptospira kirschneri str. H1]EKO60205.1 hypothetical protein LEP1GSC082_3542 [Leptospira kirschneri str. H2]EMK23598.1 hypothetical protein LEP1GSC008_3205 [Leptospira kirschneri serovar Bulgarica str. Nikolaevo]
MRVPAIYFCRNKRTSALFLLRKSILGKIYYLNVWKIALKNEWGFYKDAEILKKLYLT